MTNERKHGRALHLDNLLESQVKVTLGFKCEPMIKMVLADEAQQYGMTLSEYVETLVNNRHQTNAVVVQPPTPSAEFQGLKKENVAMKDKLTFFYENRLMRNAFEQYKGQHISYTTLNGVSKSASINAIEDVYKILFETTSLS